MVVVRYHYSKSVDQQVLGVSVHEVQVDGIQWLVDMGLEDQYALLNRVEHAGKLYIL